MKAGQRPIPTRLKLLRGNPGKQKIDHDEPQPELTSDVPEPPAFVTGYAADEWWTIATELHRMRLLSKIDVQVLAAYCYSYGQWRKAAEALARMEANDPLMSGLIIKTKYGDAAVNQLSSLARKHLADMVRYAAEFGMSPCARTRISGKLEGDHSQSKFAGLLAG